MYVIKREKGEAEDMYDDKYTDIERENEGKTWDFREVEDAEKQREELRRLRRESAAGEETAAQETAAMTMDGSQESGDIIRNVEDSSREDGQEQKDEPANIQKEVVKADAEKDDHDDGYEDVCFICRRPESKAGRMFRLPNHICVCDDCIDRKSVV